jgi:Subtilase family
MFPLSWSRAGWPGRCRRRWPGTAIMLTLACVLMIAGRSSGAEAQPLPQLAQFDAADELSAGRRFGGGRAWARGGPRKWAAHRGKPRFGGRRDRHHHDHGRDNRPGGPDRDHATKGGDRIDSAPRGRGQDRPRDRDRDPRPLPPGIATGGPSFPHIVCIAGRVLGGRCACDRDYIRLSIDRSIFRCTGRSTLAALSSPPGGDAREPGSPPPPDRGPPSPSQRPGLADRDTFVADEVLVTVARTTLDAVDDAVGRSHGLQLLERRIIPLVDRKVLRYRIADGRPVAALLAALRTDARVFDPQPNYYYRHQQDGSPGSRGTSLQYALAKMDALRAQTLARGRGALVAVIDSGADATHPDVASAIVDSFDAVGTAATGVDPHGTAIAGIIAANEILRGVAPDARLLNVRAFAPSGPERASAATTFDLLRGIDWALARRARVLNMSFTGPRDALLERGIVAAGDRGAIIVAAAGNAGANAPAAYPAAYAPVIAVTATDFADRRYRLANQGRYIALAAPGVDIVAPSGDHAHQMLSGTSFAAAHVSGIIALMIERDPALTADAARRALTATADDLGPPGPDDQYGAGRANAFAAVRLLVGH